jgi:hypothetical protein
LDRRALCHGTDDASDLAAVIAFVVLSRKGGSHLLPQNGGSHLLPQNAITFDAPADVTGLREQRARGWPGAATRRVLLSAQGRLVAPGWINLVGE